MGRLVAELRDVSVSYNGLHAIEGVNLEVEEGDFLGLLGPNGSGKSTLLKVILGLVGNCCGTVRIFGETIHQGQHMGAIRPAVKSSGMIGYLPQDVLSKGASFPGTVYEVVATGLATRTRMLKRLAGEDRRRIDDALQLTGSYEMRGRRIGDLSGGEQQRAFIARALVSGPSLLILDEPTTGVDAPTQSRLYSVLEDLNRKFGITIILSSHDLTVISKLANKLACVNRTLFYHGAPAAFFADSRKLSELYGYPVGLISHDDHLR